MPRRGTKAAADAKAARLEKRLAAALSDVGPPPAGLMEIGEPPTDLLAADEYFLRAAMVLVRELLSSPSMSAAQRRKEFRLLVHSASRLVPRARLYTAEQLIRADHAEIAKRRKPRGAVLEPVPEGELEPTAATIKPLPGRARP